MWYMTQEGRLERIHPFYVMKAVRLYDRPTKVPTWIDRAAATLLWIRQYLQSKERGAGMMETVVALFVVLVVVAIVLVPLWSTLVDGLGNVARAISIDR